MRRFRPIAAPDGRFLLNIGSGNLARPDWNNLDLSIYAELRKHMLLSRILNIIGILSDERYDKLTSLPSTIIRWDVIKGLPYEDQSFDVIYSSHMLEHIDRDRVPFVLGHAYRVLKPGGVLRIVVPDLELIIQEYMASLEMPGSTEQHEEAIDQLFEQMVRREGAGTRNQRFPVRLIDRYLIGSASKRGETHRWMYDRINLCSVLEKAGFVEIEQTAFDQSRIPGWNSFCLDCNEDGNMHEGSLYMEAIKPS